MWGITVRQPFVRLQCFGFCGSLIFMKNSLIQGFQVSGVKSVAVCACDLGHLPHLAASVQRSVATLNSLSLLLAIGCRA